MKDILIIQAARLGDLLQTRRLIISLAREYRIHLALDAGLAPLAAICYPEAILHPLHFHRLPDLDVYGANKAIFARLAGHDFEKVYNCNFSPLTDALCRLFERKKVTGYRPWRDSRGGLGRSRWARIGFQAGAMRNISPLNLVDYWGWFAENPLEPWLVNPAAAPKGGGLGIVVSGREERRSIPVETLAVLIQIASQARNFDRISLFGLESDQPKARKLRKMLKPAIEAKVRDLCGRTDLPMLVQEASRLDLLITPDTGIMHIAAFFGVPVLAIFLSSAWCHETGPYGEGHVIIQAVSACSPCLESAPCPNRAACAGPLLAPEFARTVALLLKGSKPDVQPGLEIWRTGFDSFGAKLDLFAGEDRYAEERQYCRQIVASLAGIPEAQASTGQYLRLLQKFVPDSAWMLPPWRYC